MVSLFFYLLTYTDKVHSDLKSHVNIFFGNTSASSLLYDTNESFDDRTKGFWKNLGWKYQREIFFNPDESNLVQEIIFSRKFSG